MSQSSVKLFSGNEESVRHAVTCMFCPAQVVLIPDQYNLVQNMFGSCSVDVILESIAVVS